MFNLFLRAFLRASAFGSGIVCALKRYRSLRIEVVTDCNRLGVILVHSAHLAWATGNPMPWPER
jgi:hypothetical protein